MKSIFTAAIAAVLLSTVSAPAFAEDKPKAETPSKKPPRPVMGKRVNKPAPTTPAK